MIQAAELRIGNYVKHFTEERQISLEDFHDFFTKEDPIENYKPIPLTEEWLLKFGFGKSDEHEYGNNSDLNFGFYYDYRNSYKLNIDTDKNETIYS